MPKTFRRLFAASLFVFALPLMADDPWAGAPLTGDPKEILAAAERIPTEDAAVVVLLDEARYTFDAQGRSNSVRRLIYRIAADSAVDNWGTVEVPWAPWYQERPAIEARVITKDGTVHSLDAKAISEAPAPEESLEMFSDNRIVRAPLPAVATGSVVEEVIRYSDKNPMYDAGVTDRFYFGRWVPVHQSRLVLEAPAALALRIVNKSDVQPKKETIDGGIVRTTFEAESMKAIETVEWNLPYDTSMRPYVAFSTGKSWQEIARRYSEIVDKQLAGTSVKPVTLTNADRRAIIAANLAEIQRNVRYAGVEIGESSIVPRTPDETLAHKYGDCKDKATLLVGMLRAAGLKANVVLLRAGNDLDVSNDLPGLGQFNHAIVLVDGDPPIWVDPTDEFARAGELPVQDQGRLVLVANPKTTSLIETPVYPSTANRSSETRTFILSEEGRSSVTETTEAGGADESMMRRFYLNADRKKYREQVENYAKQAYGAKALKSLDATDPRDLTKPFRLTFEMSEASRGTTEDGEAAVGIFPAGLVETLPWSLRDYQDQTAEEAAQSKRKPRTHDFVFPQPHVREWHYRIVPPPGYAARTLPPDETVKLATATLTKKYAVQPDGVVTADYTFDSGKRRITAAEFEAMRKAVHELEESKVVIIGFDQLGQLKLNQDDVAGALAEFRKLAALHPKEARHHAEIARALLAGGMGDAAREEIRRAVEIEPTYAGAQRTLGLILEHDLLGRPFRKGFDMTGALTAYRKAKELDPKNVEIRAEYARLLEFGDDGVQFGHNSHASDAVAEYQSIIDELKDNRVEGDLLLALAHAGRFKEMRDRAKTTKDQTQRELATIIAAAAIDGSAAALREAGSLDQATRKQRLGAAAQTLVTLRLYPQAADLFEQASQGSTKANEARAFIETLRKAKPYEQLTIPANEPKGVVMKLMFDAAKAGLSDFDPSPYYASDEKAILAEKEEGRLDTTTMIRLQLGAGLDDVPMTTVVDVGIAGIQFQQDGDDKSGYRLRLRTPNATPNPLKEAYLVTREGNKYVISATLSQADLVGWSVLRFADAGDVESARKWLNWFRENVTSGSADDPWAGPAFAALWPKEKETATLDEVRLAAATIMEGKPVSKKSEPILLAAREKAASDDVKMRIDSSLLAVYFGREEWQKALPVAQRIYAAHPESLFAFNVLQTALTQSGKADEAMKIANERLKTKPRDIDAVRALGGAALRKGDYAAAETYYRRVIDELSPEPNDYNNAAWNALFYGKNLDKALEDARQATPNGGGNPAALHTLATLLAETGKSLEARDALLRSMDGAGRDEPASHDWYVLGRIAENYGAKDAALAAYKRVEEKPGEGSDSTYVLAQRRMHSLTAVATK